jgi:hypothetical protein
MSYVKIAQDAFEAMQNAARDRILTCADCPHFLTNPGPTFGEGTGFCRKLKHMRIACAMACEAIFSDQI